MVAGILCERCGKMYDDVVVYLRHTVVMPCKPPFWEDVLFVATDELFPVEKEALVPLKKKWENIPAQEH